MNPIKIKHSVAWMAIGIAACGFAAGGGQTFSITPLGNVGGAPQPAAQSAAADDGETVKVQGRGVGVNKTAALKDAYRDAIERAVGLYVDAEAAVQNDQLVKDEVLTHSNAYVTEYREIGEERIDGGLVQLRILATVKKTALTAKLTGVMPAQTVNINSSGLQSVHAQLVTKEKRAEDSAALLKSALDGINPMTSLMVASLRPETQKILTGDETQRGRSRPRRSSGTEVPSAGSVTLRYLFEIKLDRAKYFAEFVPNLKKTLEQISLSKPKEIRLMELMPAYEHNGHQEHLKRYLDGESDSGDTSSFYNLIGSVGNFCACFNPIHVYSISWQGDNWVWQYYHADKYRPKAGGAFSWKTIEPVFRNFSDNFRKDKVQFALITELKDDCSGGKVTIYELDKSVIGVLNAWRTELVDKDDRGTQKTTNYNIILLDKNGEETGVYPWQIPNGALMNVKFAEIPGAGMVYATPFVGCFGESLIQWRDFILEKDQLAKIASIKIELAD